MNGIAEWSRIERTADMQPAGLSGRSSQLTASNRSTDMYLVHEQLARERTQSLREEGRRAQRASRLVAARRWQRRAERATMRARLARAAVV
jgi:hypothetical protein